MANEFYIRKGLAIATASVAFASGPTQSTRYLVLGNDNIVRWATASTSGGSSVINTNANYQFDDTAGVNTVNPDPGGFTYWNENNAGGPVLNLSGTFSVSHMKIKINDLSNTNNEAFFLSINGTGNTGNWTENAIVKTYNYSTDMTKGYIAMRSLSGTKLHVFRAVARGWWAAGGPGGLTVANSLWPSTNPTTIDYYICALNAQVNNFYEIHVVYEGYINTSLNPVDNEQYNFSFTPGSYNPYMDIMVAAPAYSFQINDGGSPANLGAYGLSINNRGSIFLNGLSSRIRGATGSRDTTILGSGAGITMSFATASTFIGASAGAAHKSGYSNTFIGAYAGIKNITGHRNTFIGESAGYNNLEDDNIFIGVGAGFRNVSGCGNVFMGIAAGAGATYSHESVFIGVNSGILAHRAEHSVFVGAYSGGSAATSSNTFIGYFSGNSTTFGNENTFVGSETGVNNTTGKGNTYIGALAGFGTFSGGTGVTGSFNTFVGTRTGLNNRGDNNTFIGAYSGLSNTTGAFNMFVGINAGASNSTGSFNTFIGNEAGSQALNSSKVTSIGPRAGYTNRADNNVFIGNDTGLQNTTGDENFFIGTNAGCLNTSGGKNLYLGYLAGAQSGIGNYNAFIGSYAGCRNVSGSYNTFIGYSAGERATFAQNNTFIGQYAGRFTGALAGGDSVCDNLYVGNYSGQGESNSLANVSCANTFLGQLAGQKKQSGNENVFIGYQSGRYNFTGQRNIFIGSLSATGSNGISDSIVIGYAAVPTANNQFVLASTQVPVGTASSGVFSHFLNAKINGIDMKIPLYY